MTLLLIYYFLFLSSGIILSLIVFAFIHKFWCLFVELINQIVQ